MDQPERSAKSMRSQISEEERGGWSNNWDFLFSCISLSVGLGNVWRFPYLCFRNGGGAFLVTYGVAMIFCGIPIFFQEVAIGQYLGEGGMTLVGQLCPLLKGVGYATMTLVFLLNIYYCIIIAWTLFYLVNTFSQLPNLPWGHCENKWNTPSCCKVSRDVFVNNTHTPVEEFWDHHVLEMSDGVDNLNGIKWDLFVCLAVGWILVYWILRRGLNHTGKLIWFTACAPYVVLFLLLGRAVTLDGAGEGLLFYVTPQWSALLTAGPWIDGATQIFFAYSSGTGALQALGSYNKFHHNCYRDAIITTIINTLTSLVAGMVTFAILGHIAWNQKSSVADVVKTGPGLVFLTYPEVIVQLPGGPIWSVIFFLMLGILGVDSLFCLVESIITGMVDMWPHTLRQNRKKFTFGMCVVMFLLGIPMVTRGGIYIFQIMDYYSASGISLLWICFFETLAASWVFGTERFCDSIYEMMGIRLGVFWRLCWKYFTPLVMGCIFIFECVQFTPLKYGKDYEYPTWATLLGLALSLASMIWIPGYALFYVICGPKSLKKNLRNGLTPNIVERYK